VKKISPEKNCINWKESNQQNFLEQFFFANASISLYRVLDNIVAVNSQERKEMR
jgi:hypothetical protein